MPRLSDRAPWRVWLCGLLSLPAAAMVLAPLTLRFWPPWPGIHALQRILENLTPQLAMLGTALAVLLALTGARRLGAGFLVLGLAGLGLSLWHLRPITAAPAPGPGHLTVLWYNLLNENTTPPADLADALAASPADIVIVTEAVPLRGELDALRAAFPARIGCRNRLCELVILARNPDVDLRLRAMDSARPRRIAAARIEIPGRAAVTVLAAHLAKPWFFGYSEIEEWFLFDELEQTPGPLVLTADLNATPWSDRVGRLVHECGLRLPPRPHGSWPAALGRFGLAIDHVMVRGGARLVSVTPWEGEGSNHRGLLAVIDLPPAGTPEAAVPAACTVPADTRERLGFD